MTGIPQHSKKTVEWYTPREIVESSRAVMGRIDLDPASNHVAQETVKASAVLHQAHEGLQHAWKGNVFLKPPGGDAPQGSPTKSNSVLWWSKLVHEYRVGNTEQAIFIGFSIEILQAAQALNCDQPLDFPYCIPRERIRFIDHRTLAPARMPAHANVIVFLPPKKDIEHAKHTFRREFFKYGRIQNV